MKFLRNLLASIMGSLIALTIIFVIGIAIISVAVQEPEIKVEPNNILVLKLDKEIQEHTPGTNNPFYELIEDVTPMSLAKLLESIDYAKKDDKISGISIQADLFNGSMEQLRTIREKLKSFKAAGKFVVSYADYYTQKAYYLSSVADSVFVNPMGAIDFNGLTAETLYYKDLQDKVGVQMDVIRHGSFKSAGEPFLLNKMSNENRLQLSTLLKSLWSGMLNDISISRGKTVEELEILAEQSALSNVDEALSNNMVDGLLYRDEYKDRLKNLTHSSKLTFMDMEDYMQVKKLGKSSVSSNRIAIIYAEGDILYGKGTPYSIGHETFTNLLKKVREDKKIKAVVLRINSPGGSALASELIWREIELTKEEKTVVVSMGGLAASGGYYIACNADVIYASPSTITGSIGVFTMLPNVSKLATRWGINSEQVSSTNSPYYSPFKPLSDEYIEITKKGVSKIYRTFLERVATGRNMTMDEVDAVAQGRVWTADDALDAGLIDSIGGIDDAIEHAAELAEIDDFKTVKYPRFFEEDFEGMLGSLLTKGEGLSTISKNVELSKAYLQLYNTLKQTSRFEGIQARVPFSIDIH